MHMTCRRWFYLALLIAAAFSMALPVNRAVAQEKYPARPITLIAPYAAGGGFDALARILAGALAKELGTQVVVQNIGGAGGVLGTRQASQADPDGYTVLLNHMGMATSPSLVKNLQFDPVQSFALRAKTSADANHIRIVMFAAEFSDFFVIN